MFNASVIYVVRVTKILSYLSLSLTNLCSKAVKDRKLWVPREMLYYLVVPYIDPHRELMHISRLSEHRA